MKSAYELAMERLEAEAGPSKKLSEDQKRQCAEVDRKFEAQIAQTKLSFENKIAPAGPEEAPALEKELADEISRLSSACEAAKEKIRGDTD